jgi:hypothetical protein
MNITWRLNMLVKLFAALILAAGLVATGFGLSGAIHSSYFCAGTGCSNPDPACCPDGEGNSDCCGQDHGATGDDCCSEK